MYIIVLLRLILFSFCDISGELYDGMCGDCIDQNQVLTQLGNNATKNNHYFRCDYVDGKGRTFSYANYKMQNDTHYHYYGKEDNN